MFNGCRASAGHEEEFGALTMVTAARHVSAVNATELHTYKWLVVSIGLSLF